MSELRFIIGDVTHPEGAGPRVIVHVCNDLGRWGKGFVLALSKRWPQPEAAFRRWHQHGPEPFGLGEVQLVQVEAGLWVANLVGQHGLKPKGGVPPVRLEAIAQGLERVAGLALARRASVHLPRIGCGLAGGRWEQIEPLLRRSLVAQGLDAFVYDLPNRP